MKLTDVDIQQQNSMMNTGFASGRIKDKSVNGFEFSEPRQQLLMSPSPGITYTFRYKINERVIATGVVEFHYIEQDGGTVGLSWVARTLKYVNQNNSEYLIGRTNDFRIEWPIDPELPPLKSLKEFVNWTIQAIITYAKKHFTRGL